MLIGDVVLVFRAIWYGLLLTIDLSFPGCGFAGDWGGACSRPMACRIGAKLQVLRMMAAQYRCSLDVVSQFWPFIGKAWLKLTASPLWMV